MTIHTKVSGAWVPIAQSHTRIQGVWRPNAAVYTRADGRWRQVDPDNTGPPKIVGVRRWMTGPIDGSMAEGTGVKVPADPFLNNRFSYPRVPSWRIVGDASQIASVRVALRFTPQEPKSTAEQTLEWEAPHGWGIYHLAKWHSNPSGVGGQNTPTENAAYWTAFVNSETSSGHPLPTIDGGMKFTWAAVPAERPDKPGAFRMETLNSFVHWYKSDPDKTYRYTASVNAPAGAAPWRIFVPFTTFISPWVTPDGTTKTVDLVVNGAPEGAGTKPPQPCIEVDGPSVGWENAGSHTLTGIDVAVETGGGSVSYGVTTEQAYVALADSELSTAAAAADGVLELWTPRRGGAFVWGPICYDKSGESISDLPSIDTFTLAGTFPPNINSTTNWSSYGGSYANLIVDQTWGYISTPITYDSVTVELKNSGGTVIDSWTGSLPSTNDEPPVTIP